MVGTAEPRAAIEPVGMPRVVMPGAEPPQPGTPAPRIAASRYWRRSGTATLGIVVTVIVAALVLPPVWTLLHTSFAPEETGSSAGGVTLGNYVLLLRSRDPMGLLLNSLVFSFVAMAVSLAVGGVLAWLVERTDAPFRSLAYVTAIISLATPFILYVTAWIFLLGRAGPLNDIYRQFTGTMGSPFNINSLPGMILVEAFLWSPLVFLLMSATFRTANAEMEEAARISGATVFESIRFVSLKLARPAILALAMFVFILNLEAFEVPALIGIPGRVDVLTTEIFRSVKEFPPRIGYASAFSVVMLLVISVLLYFYGRISRQAERYASITGKGYRPRPLRLGRGRWLAGAIIVVNFVIVLLAPLLAVVWIAIMPFIRPMRWDALHTATFKHFLDVTSSAYYLSLVGNTLIVAAGVATAAMMLTLVAGWLAARRRSCGRIIDQLIVVPLIFPGIVLGVALLELALRSPIPVYGTLWLIGLAFLIHYMPFGMRYTYAGVLQIHPELEQAAHVAGASIRQNIIRIVLPLLMPALSSAWLFIFLLASKEMSLPLLLAGASSQTIAVAMFNLWANGQGSDVAVLGLLWTALMTGFATIFYILSRRHSSAAFGN
jgi:iron(III) transport system permease protein